jgi:hypothetical protein
MIVEIRFRCCLCEVCKRKSPRAPARERDLETGLCPTEEAAKAAGWVVHAEQIRTPVRKQPTGTFRMQYFCPKHKKKAGTIEVLKPARKPREPRKERERDPLAREFPVPAPLPCASGTLPPQPRPRRS